MPGTTHPQKTMSVPVHSCAALLLLLLVACGQVPAATVPMVSSSPFAAIALRTRPEMVVSSPCGPLWAEGEELSLHGLYRTTGEQGYLDVARPAVDGPGCWSRFFLDRDLGLGTVPWDEPGYVEVVGRVVSGHWDSAGLWDLQVLRWAVLPFDADAARSVCRGTVAAQASTLQSVDWAALASPAFVTGTTGFQPAAAALAGATVQLEGADDRGALVVLSVRGPDLPAVRPLVTRWLEVECVYDVDQAQVVALTATIHGEVQE